MPSLPFVYLKHACNVKESNGRELGTGNLKLRYDFCSCRSAYPLCLIATPFSPPDKVKVKGILRMSHNLLSISLLSVNGSGSLIKHSQTA
eukprot:scaffold2787_cov109-Skeletonema_marinoi.AAC.3